MTDVELVTRSAGETRELAAAVGEVLRPGDLVVLAGDLGTGKTTFAQGVAAALGVEGPVTSPSFTIVQEYEGRLRLAHVDVYRLDRLQELHDVGFEEVMGDDRVTLVEWGDVVAQALPNDPLVVRIRPGSSDDERVFDIEGRGPSWHDRLDRLAPAVGRFVSEREPG